MNRDPDGPFRWVMAWPCAALRRHGLSRLARQDVRGLRSLARAARAGDVEACFHLGQSYSTGKTVPQCATEAIRWLRLAASAGHSGAQFHLAALLAQGNRASPRSQGPFDSGCARDIVEAASWAQRAAEGGIADAQVLYAWILRDGPAELRDPEASAVWYRRAAESGSPEGWLGTGIALLRAAPGPADEATGAAAVTRAADARLPAALHLLGMLTEAGIGVPVDKSAAHRLFQAAAAGGSPAAQAKWGDILLHGRDGGRQNVREGLRWLRRAAHSGDAEAAALLGDLCFRGEAVPVDVVAAKAWYRRAAALGHEAARRILHEMPDNASP